MKAITEFLEKLRVDLADSMLSSGLDKRGNIGKRLRVEELDNGGRLWGWKWIEVRTEYGRPPTGAGATKGTPTFREAILRWVESEGIGEPKDRKSIAYLISRKIHRSGDMLFRGEKTLKPPTGVLTNVLNDGRIEDLKRKMIIEFQSGLRQ